MFAVMQIAIMLTVANSLHTGMLESTAFALGFQSTGGPHY